MGGEETVDGAHRDLAVIEIRQRRKLAQRNRTEQPCRRLGAVDIA
jgi:hypothetical protein